MEFWSCRGILPLSTTTNSIGSIHNPRETRNAFRNALGTVSTGIAVLRELLEDRSSNVNRPFTPREWENVLSEIDALGSELANVKRSAISAYGSEIEPGWRTPGAARDRFESMCQPTTTDSASLLSLTEVCRRLGLDDQRTVHHRLEVGTLLGWEGPEQQFVFPADQFDADGQVLPCLEELLSEFPDHFSAWHWLSSPHVALKGRIPVEYLKDGENGPSYKEKFELLKSAAQGDAWGAFS